MNEIKCTLCIMIVLSLVYHKIYCLKNASGDDAELQRGTKIVLYSTSIVGTDTRMSNLDTRMSSLDIRMSRLDIRLTLFSDIFISNFQSRVSIVRSFVRSFVILV